MATAPQTAKRTGPGRLFSWWLAAVTLLFFLDTSVRADATTHYCPEGWTYGYMKNGLTSLFSFDYCYTAEAMPNDNLLGWDPAQEACNAASTQSKLASIHTAAENSLVQGLCNDQCWLGYNGFQSVSTWVDSSSLDYQNRDPNDQLLTSDCLVLLGPSGLWNGADCITSVVGDKAICKMSASKCRPACSATETEVTPCGGNSNRVCECKTEHYRNSEGVCTECRAKCGFADNTVQQCSASNNRVCECESGYFRTDQSDGCTACEQCGPAREEAAPCTATSDRECRCPVPNHFFSESANDCVECTTCANFTVEVQECSATQDRVCQCVPGRYFNPATGTCVECTPCGEFSEEAEECTPTSDRVCACLPGHVGNPVSACKSCLPCGEHAKMVQNCTHSDHRTCECLPGFYGDPYSATGCLGEPYCPSGWNQYTPTIGITYCYRREGPMDGGSAGKGLVVGQQKCGAWGAHMTSIHDKGENDFVRNMCGDICWIGLVDPSYPYYFNDDHYWLDGTPVDYLNFAESLQSHEDCVFFYKSYGWADVACTNGWSSAFTVCKKVAEQCRQCGGNATSTQTCLQNDERECACGENFLGSPYDNCYCPENTWWDQADNTCRNFIECDFSYEYEEEGPTPTSNRVCNKVLPCLDSQFETAPATLTSNTQCKDLTVCLAGQTMTVAPTKTSDRRCEDCPPGFHHPSSDPSEACKPCPHGTFSNVSGVGEACPMCPPGFVDNDRSPLTECVECGPGHSIDQGSAGNCDEFCCPSGFFEAANKCLQCSAGTFSTPCSSLCLFCPAGYIDHDSNASTFCQPCPPGTQVLEEGREGSCSNFLCPIGTFDHDKQAHSPCAECPPDTFQNHTGQISCMPMTPCPFGFWELVPGTPSNDRVCTDVVQFCESFATADQKTCSRCKVGYFLTNSSHVCAPCIAGHACANGVNMESCNAGEYQPDIQADRCLICPAGSLQRLQAQAQCDDCGPGAWCPSPLEQYFCAPGEFQPSRNSTTGCLPCPNGTHSPDSRTDVCTPCLGERYAPNQGMTTCFNMSTGHYGVQGQAHGYVQELPCDLGHQCVNGTATPCPAGYFQNDTAQDHCIPCGMGKFSDEVGRTTPCDDIFPGLYGVGGTSPDTHTGVLPCPAGHRCLLGKAEPCPPGHFQPSGGEPSCFPCESTSYSSNFGSEGCELISPGEAGIDADGRVNVPPYTGVAECQPGFFCPGDGRQIACEAGLFATSQSFECLTCEDTCAPGTTFHGCVPTNGSSICVDDIPPDVYLRGNSTLIHEAGTSFSDPGADAVDMPNVTLDAFVDPDVGPVPTGFVAGTFQFAYTARDAAGNMAARKTRTVYVRDTKPPTLTLLGRQRAVIVQGEGFPELRAKAVDLLDGDISPTVTRTGAPPNTNKIGTFTITYTVVDANGNAAPPINRTLVILSLAKETAAMNKALQAYQQAGSQKGQDARREDAWLTYSEADGGFEPTDFFPRFNAALASSNEASSSLPVAAIAGAAAGVIVLAAAAFMYRKKGRRHSKAGLVQPFSPNEGPRMYLTDFRNPASFGVVDMDDQGEGVVSTPAPAEYEYDYHVAPRQAEYEYGTVEPDYAAPGKVALGQYEIPTARYETPHSVESSYESPYATYAVPTETDGTPQYMVPTTDGCYAALGADAATYQSFADAASGAPPAAYGVGTSPAAANYNAIGTSDAADYNTIADVAKQAPTTSNGTPQAYSKLSSPSRDAKFVFSAPPSNDVSTVDVVDSDDNSDEADVTEGYVDIGDEEEPASVSAPPENTVSQPPVHDYEDPGFVENRAYESAEPHTYETPVLQSAQKPRHASLSVSNSYEALPQTSVSMALVTSLRELWFQPKLSRDEAAAMLKTEPLGSFVVRDSSMPGLQAISVRGDGEVWNGILESTSQGVGVKGANYRAKDLNTLVLDLLGSEELCKSCGMPTQLILQ